MKKQRNNILEKEQLITREIKKKTHLKVVEKKIKKIYLKVL